MADLLRLMQNRHDVHDYSDNPIEPEKAAKLYLENIRSKVNEQSGR